MAKFCPVCDENTDCSARGEHTCVVCGVNQWTTPRARMNYLPERDVTRGRITLCELCLEEILTWGEERRQYMKEHPDG